MEERSILHVDINNFYASVECMLHPELKPFPVAVCGNKEERHGIVLAKNDLAKMRGVKTGDVIWQALEKCPNLVVVPPNYEAYMQFSAKARAIYERYTDKIEPFGMDEVWMDVTDCATYIGTPLRIAEQIRESVKRELGITVSIGVSFNKVFAKLGSDMKKPDAITVIPRDSFREIIYDLPASAMLGVGRATAVSLASVCICTIGDMATYPLSFFRSRFGKVGEMLWKSANGMDFSPVVPTDPEVPDKSVGHGMTAVSDLENASEVWTFILGLCQDIGHKLYVYKKKAVGVSLSVRNANLSTKQWQCRLALPSQSPSVIAKTAFELYEKNNPVFEPLRSVTVRAIDLVPCDVPQQIDMFVDVEKLAKAENLDRTVENLRQKFGKFSIRPASLLGSNKMSTEEHSGIAMPKGTTL